MTPAVEGTAAALRVALIQTHPEPLQLERNFATAAEYIRRAAADGATLAVLPEYHLSSWQPEDPAFAQIAAKAESYVPRYQALAKQYGIHIVPGTIVMRGGGHEPDTLLNKTYFINSVGEVLGEYTKTNVWRAERKYLTSGPEYRKATGSMMKPNHEVISTPLGPVGLLICYDLSFPEASRALVRAGARIIIIPTFAKCDDTSTRAGSYNRDCEKLVAESALVSRAFENTCCMIFCNAGGPEEDGFMGLSQVTMPIVGKLSGSFTNSAPGLRIVDVDLEILDAAEENYMTRQDLARDDFHYRP